ncbi:uncharacterized protein LOC101845807 [Aplysia californica]|uniref:Uncharacterized protein LOC101845807 n=1 Tax=Aplysia californica TaxID=6500 RepID=A0ABM1AB93_APLCA|nr:uncharacterized protein LOC101845807 [Aplysia californica]
MSKYMNDVDSKEPFIEKNHLSSGPSNAPMGDNHGNGSTTPANNISGSNNTNSSSSNGNNNSNYHYGGGAPPNNSNSMKQTSQQLDYSHLERTIARLRTYLFAMFGVGVAGFIILIIVVTVLYVNLNYDLVHHRHKPKVGEQAYEIMQKEELCVPCDDFRLGPSPEEERELKKFRLKEGPEGVSCCVDTPVELMLLLKMFVERRFRQEVAKGTISQWPRASSVVSGGSEGKPAAHLMITTQDLSDVKEEHGRQFIIGRWNYDADLAFTYRTTYRSGRIVIPEDGYYFVYSQISFMETFDLHTAEGYGSRHSSDVPSLSHYLFRYNILYHNGGEEKLAQNSITKCWGQSKTFGEYVSNLGAVFYLRNSDEIFVKVSNITMVSTDPKMSHFGLFKI